MGGARSRGARPFLPSKSIIKKESKDSKDASDTPRYAVTAACGAVRGTSCPLYPGSISPGAVSIIGPLYIDASRTWSYRSPLLPPRATPPLPPISALRLAPRNALEDRERARFRIERVQVHGINPNVETSVRNRNAQLHPVLLHGLLVVLDALELLLDLLRDTRLAEPCHALEPVIAHHRHNPGDDRARDTRSTAVLDPRLKLRHVVKELRHDEVRAGVDLRLQVRQVLLVVRLLESGRVKHHRDEGVCWCPLRNMPVVAPCP